MDTLPSHVLDYAAGNMDGDGCIIVGQHQCLTVALDKAQKSMNVLEFFKDNFGGNIYNKRTATEKSQSLHDWRLNGPKAFELINALKDRSYIKREQFQVAATFDMSYKLKIVAVKGDEVAEFLTETACMKTLGISVKHVRRLYGTSETCKGWSLTKVYQDKAAVSAQRTGVDNELRRLKQVAHPPITVQLPFAYCAGLFDAEGCVSIYNRSSWKIEVSQGYPEILFALKRQFGGSVFVSQKTARRCNWQLYSGAGRHFLQGILPFLIEKKRQVELVLNMDPGSGEEVKKLLRELKGNYTTGMKFASDALPAGEQLDPDMILEEDPDMMEVPISSILDDGIRT